MELTPLATRRKCKICGRIFTVGINGKQTNRQVCGPECERKRDNENNRIRRPKAHVAKGVAGGPYGPGKCWVCGEEITVTKPIRPRKYCSKKCNRLAKKAGGSGMLKGISPNQGRAILAHSLKPEVDRSAQRTCLKCGEKFWSCGPQNRICPACHGHINAVQQYDPREVWGG